MWPVKSQAIKKNKAKTARQASLRKELNNNAYQNISKKIKMRPL